MESVISKIVSVTTLSDIPIPHFDNIDCLFEMSKFRRFRVLSYSLTLKLKLIRNSKAVTRKAQPWRVVCNSKIALVDTIKYCLAVSYA